METIRKIQMVGNRSFTVSLPKKWVLENNLDKQKNISIYNQNNNLIISTKKQDKDQSKIEINIQDVPIITSIILLCYTKGIFELTLRFQNKETYLKAKEHVNEILFHLDGFKITDEEENKITITSLYEKHEMSISKIAKRMTSILNQMNDCILNGQTNTKKILENELDSLYHLSKRTLYICSTDYEVKTKNNIQDIEEIFLWRLIFKKLENIGDIIENIKEHEKNKIKEITKIIKPLNDIFILNKQLKYELIDNLKKTSFEFSELEKIKDLTIDILNNYFLIKLNIEYFSTKIIK